MKSYSVCLVACLLASQQAAAEIYKCSDADGGIHYGDKPCAGESTVFTPRAGPKSDENIEERREKTQRLLRAYREERAQDKQKAAELESEKKQRVENCHRARNRHRQVTAAGRMYWIDDDGSRIDFTEQERADAIARTRAEIEAWCN